MNYLDKIRKALFAGFGAGFTAYTAANTKGHLTLTDWEIVVGSTVVVGFVTWFIPNEKSNPSNTGNTGVTKP